MKKIIAVATRDGHKIFDNMDDYEAWLMQGTNRWKVIGKPFEVEPTVVADPDEKEQEVFPIYRTVYATIDKHGEIVMSEDEDDVLLASASGYVTKYTVMIEV